MMKMRRSKILIAITGALCGIMVLVSARTGEAGSGDYGKLAAEWWKWVYSIPCTTAFCPNPVIDTTGDYGAVGQHGEVWFLAGTFGGAVTRNVYVPEGSPVFFPVANNAFFDTPNACGQGPVSFSVEEMRAIVAAVTDKAINLSATLDGKPLKIVREQSVVFDLPIPKDNLAEPCAQGIYSPAVDDGYYVLLKKLDAGLHTLHFHAEIPPGFVTDVTYKLTVVPLQLK